MQEIVISLAQGTARILCHESLHTTTNNVSGYTCGTWPPPWVCTSSFIGFPSTTLDLFTTGSKSGSYSNIFGGANAFSVQIRFQPTDFVSPHATSAVTDAQSPGLSTGAKAGIGVGVAIGVLTLLLLGALLLWRRRRKPKTDQTPVTHQTPYGVDTKQELDGTSYATPRVKNTSPPVTELEASEAHSDLTSSQPGTRILDPIASDAQFEDAAKLPGLAASSEINSSFTDPQEPADAVPETQSTASAPHEVRLREVDEEHDIRQQIKRIRTEKERLARIDELERLEAELQERLAGPTTTGN
jgi:MYXO-CTERM domain-containing protein